MANLERSEDGGARILTMNRPDSRNALDTALLESLLREFKEAQKGGVRCVVLEGRGVDFSAGGDVNEPLDEKGMHYINDLLNELVRLVYTLACPTIAMIRGNVLASSLDIALACDLRFAGESARFRTGFDRFGIPTESLTHALLPRLMGLDRAKHLFFSGEVISGAEAYDAGLATRVFPDESLRDETMAFARKVASGPTWAYAQGKQLMNESNSRTLDENLSAGRNIVIEAEKTADFREAMAALSDGRKPVFVGR